MKGCRPAQPPLAIMSDLYNWTMHLPWPDSKSMKCAPTIDRWSLCGKGWGKCVCGLNHTWQWGYVDRVAHSIMAWRLACCWSRDTHQVGHHASRAKEWHPLMTKDLARWNGAIGLIKGASEVENWVKLDMETKPVKSGREVCGGMLVH